MQDVILRIYRETEEDKKKRVQQGAISFSSSRRRWNDGYYSKRLALGDDCDEVCFVHIVMIV